MSKPMSDYEAIRRARTVLAADTRDLIEIYREVVEVLVDTLVERDEFFRDYSLKANDAHRQVVRERDDALVDAAAARQAEHHWTGTVLALQAAERERDAALLALSELCEAHGGTEPHTLPACTAHLKAVLIATSPCTMTMTVDSTSKTTTGTR